MESTSCKLIRSAQPKTSSEVELMESRLPRPPEKPTMPPKTSSEVELMESFCARASWLFFALDA